MSAKAFHQIAARWPEYGPIVSEFPSGAAMLDLMVRGIRYTAEYFPGPNRYGLSKTATATFGWEGVEQSFDTAAALENAIAQLTNAE
jgi:hypothetical protein